MRIESSVEGATFRYRLHPDQDDPLEGRRGFADHPTPFALVRHEYQVALPRSFTRIHPDVHAVAIWYALRPFIGSHLELPFGVSADLAKRMARDYAVDIGPVDAACTPRAQPEQQRPVLLFSGGMDSMAASLLMPPTTRALFLDRIVPQQWTSDSDVLVDLQRQRDACDALRSDGLEVYATRDDHEWLMQPYPIWHSDMAILSALYMADSLHIATFDTGEVLDAVHFGGYQGSEPTGWRFGQTRSQPSTQGGAPAASADDHAFLGAIGLVRAESISGLSEVATASIVARSHRRGKSFSCYYRSESAFCMRCDKCMKKLLLSHIAMGEAVPASLIDQFLSVPHLRHMFRRRFLDWHHVWYYVFQKIDCDHWFVKELQRQATAGPDLTLLERWYPPSRDRMVGLYRDDMIARIVDLVPAMSTDDIERLEHLDVPPLEAPDLGRFERPAHNGSVQPRARPPADPATATLAEQVRHTVALADLAGYRVTDVQPHDRDGSVHVTLERPGSRARPRRARARVVLLVLPSGDRQAPAFKRVRGRRVCYHESTPVDTTTKLAAVEAFCRVLARLPPPADAKE